MIDALMLPQGAIFWEGFQLENVPAEWWPMFEHFRPALQELANSVKAHQKTERGGQRERSLSQAKRN